MPQDSEAGPKVDTALAASIARLLDEVRDEPVPDVIRDLAERLDKALVAGPRMPTPKAGD